MNAEQFLAELRAALRGMPVAEIEEIAQDYAAHFAEARAAGRSEAEVAAALGDPARLARELRAESGLQRWRDRRTPGNYVAAIVALCGLAAVDLIVLLPLLLVLAVAAFAIGVVVFALIVAGIALLAGATGWSPLEGWAYTTGLVLAGTGLIAGGLGAGALVLLALEGLLLLLGRYARLHYQILRPADDAA
jgi:uncharacterized membrane protein